MVRIQEPAQAEQFSGLRPNMKPSRTGQHSILIVDDELSSIRLIEEVLSTHSLDCMATEDGYEALRLVEQHQFVRNLHLQKQKRP